MTATATDLRGCGPFADSTPAEVRAALPPEDVAAFDAEWRAVLGRAAESLDLAEMNEMLDGWRRTARSFTHDPAAHRHMIDVASRLRRGEYVHTVTWDQLKAELGL